MKIGAKTVILQNVPDDITDEELKKIAIKKLLEIGIMKTGVAS